MMLVDSPLGQEAPRPRSLEDLQEILQMYNEVTQRLQVSHEKLQAEVVRLTEQLAEKNLELERKKRLAALGEMAAGIAHEIRNPLGGIQLYASTLLADLADRPQSAELVRKISSGVKGLNALVSDMLAFTRDLNLRKQEVCLGDLAAAVVELATPTLRQHNIHVRVAPELDALVICVDAKLLERVLLNLVLNAAEAIGERGGTARQNRIEISARRGAGHIAILVADNGPGIPLEALDKIFDPFFTTKHTGTGLGLAIVNRIVEAHGGSITAQNRPEGGAYFRIHLSS
jgi:signal transduction histidine kinase